MGLRIENYFAMLRHASANCLHALAHFLQWSMACLEHSFAQASHASAHRAHTASKCVPPEAIDVAARRQISAHSKSKAMQWAIGLGLSSIKQAVAHCRQAATHAMHATKLGVGSSYVAEQTLWRFAVILIGIA